MEVLEKVKTRLTTFGYTAVPTDESLIALLIDKITAEIKLNCNIAEIPVEAKPLVVDIIAGEFLQQKKAIGADLEGINLEAVAKSIKLGDTTVDFGNNGNPESQFNALVNALINSNKNMITASLRRIDWS